LRHGELSFELSAAGAEACVLGDADGVDGFVDDIDNGRRLAAHRTGGVVAAAYRVADVNLARSPAAV
jgi:hypothetical protein